MRGFETCEFEARVARAQALMAQHDLSGLLLTTEPEIRYFTGFLTRFWESPTRPWFLVVPQSGAPVAVIPSIGAHLMGQTWITDIRTWQAPDYADDGVGLLLEALRACGGRIGVPDQMESHVRMPLAALRQIERQVDITSDGAIMRRLRMVKSDAEIAKIAASCAAADRAFARVAQIAAAGVPQSQVHRGFQCLCLEEGADAVPYLAGAAGQGGYGDVISPATDAPLAPGDVLMLDTGLVRDGYFCDFDRNFSVGPPSRAVRAAHGRLMEAVQAGFEAAKPGARVSQLFAAMQAAANPQGGGCDAGRLGHGLGMQLTEWPSIIAQDHTVLEAGHVLTLEPSTPLAQGRLMVHEENIVITQTGARFLSDFQPAQMRILP